MFMKLDKWLATIHLVNFAWMTRLLIIGLQNEVLRNNYWSDPFFSIPILAGCCLLVFRWMQISKVQIDLNIESSISLKIQMREIADEMFGKTPYLLKISPGDHVLSEFSVNYFKNNSGKIAREKLALQRMFFDIKNYIAVNFIILLISGFYLYFGGLPSYAAHLAQIPLLPVIVFCMAGGLFSYSLAFLMFGCFTFFSKRA